MSTTNPTGRPPATRSAAWPDAARHADGRTTTAAAAPPTAEAIARGHEAGRATTPRASSACRCWWSLFFVLAFGTVDGHLRVLHRRRRTDPSAHPQAVERNKAPLNERHRPDRPRRSEVDQPRLEPLKRPRAATRRAITRPDAADGELARTSPRRPAGPDRHAGAVPGRLARRARLGAASRSTRRWTARRRRTCSRCRRTRSTAAAVAARADRRERRPRRPSARPPSRRAAERARAEEGRRRRTARRRTTRSDASRPRDRSPGGQEVTLRTRPMLSRRAGCLGAAAVPGRAPATVGVARAPRRQQARPEVGIDEKIGDQVPLDLVVPRRERAADHPRRVHRRQADDPRAGVLPLPDALHRGAQRAARRAAGDAARTSPSATSSTSSTVSFDPKEHADLAAAKKKAYLARVRPARGREGWRFLTGKKESIAELLDAVGFQFEFDKVFKEYNHPSGIIILSPEGKMTRYFYGIDYDGEIDARATQATRTATIDAPTTTLRLSLVEAADGKVGSLLDKLIAAAATASTT